jgi:hypothetical protein
MKSVRNKSGSFVCFIVINAIIVYVESFQFLDIGANFKVKKIPTPAYVYNVSMYFPNPLLVINTSSSPSFLSPSYKRYQDDHGKNNKNDHNSYIAKHVNIIDYKKYTETHLKKLSLEENGFEYIDIDPTPALQNLLSAALEYDLNETLAYKIRKKLSNFFTTLSDNSYLYLLHIVDEGMVIRRNRPGCDIQDCEHIDNNEVGAKTVHGDQDLYGQPLHSILLGFAPFLFHRTYSPLRILNVWIPLQEVRLRPLALMDVTTLNRTEHQLRYHIINKFMQEGDGNFLLNDCWTFLHHQHQKWFFYEGQNSDKAIIFDTTGTPHGTFMVPGEKYLRTVLNGLVDIHDHVVKREEDDCFPVTLKDSMLRILRENHLTHSKSTQAIKRALEEIQEFIIHTVLHHGIVDDDNKMICIHDIRQFKAKVEHLININTRVSLEMRAIGFLVTHNTFISMTSTIFILFISWKIFSFLLLNLILKPDKFMVGVCRRCLKSLFQIPDTSDGE